MKKIAIIASSWLTYQHFFLRHALILSRSYEITFIFDHTLDNYEGFDEFTCNTIHIKIPRKISIIEDIRSVFSLCNVMRKNNFSGVITLSPKAGLVGMLASRFVGVGKRIHIFQGAVWSSKKNVLRVILLMFDYFIARLAVKKLFVSNSLCELYKKNGFSVGRDEVIGRGSICGVDLTRFKKDLRARVDIRTQLGFCDSDVVCIYLGRVTADKGVRELVEAFAMAKMQNQNLKLLVVGPKEDESFDQALEKFSNIRTHVKRVQYTKVPEFYLNAGDIFVFPSYREGFGVAIIEASAVGLPIVASRIPGVVDAVAEGVTGLFTDGSASHLAIQISLLSNDEVLRKKIGQCGSLYVKENYSSTVVVGLYCDFFQQQFGV